MPIRPLDLEIDRITTALVRCGNRAIALHAAACAERLFDIYVAYAVKDRTGEPETVRNALNLVWDYLKGIFDDEGRLTPWSPILERATPHADDCKSVECLLAPNVCVCIDTAVRYCLGDISLGPVSVEYALEARRALQCYLLTGCVDLGSGPEAMAFDDKLLESTLVRNELEMQQVELEELRDRDHIPMGLVERFHERATSNRLNISNYLDNPSNPRI